MDAVAADVRARGRIPGNRDVATGEAGRGNLQPNLSVVLQGTRVYGSCQSCEHVFFTECLQDGDVLPQRIKIFEYCFGNRVNNLIQNLCGSKKGCLYPDRLHILVVVSARIQCDGNN